MRRQFRRMVPVLAGALVVVLAVPAWAAHSVNSVTINPTTNNTRTIMTIDDLKYVYDTEEITTYVEAGSGGSVWEEGQAGAPSDGDVVGSVAATVRLRAAFCFQATNNYNIKWGAKSNWSYTPPTGWTYVAVMYIDRATTDIPMYVIKDSNGDYRIITVVSGTEQCSTSNPNIDMTIGNATHKPLKNGSAGTWDVHIGVKGLSESYHEITKAVTVT